AIKKETAAYKTFNDLKNSLNATGRADELEGLTSVDDYRKRLRDQAQAAFNKQIRDAQTQEQERVAAEIKAEEDVARQKISFMDQVELNAAAISKDRITQIAIEQKKRIDEARELFTVDAEFEAAKTRILKAAEAERAQVRADAAAAQSQIQFAKVSGQISGVQS